MRILSQAHKAIRLPLKVLLIFALVIIFLVDILWANVPEIFSYGAEIGVLIERVCMSYIASYVFFLFGVHWKSVQDKERVNPYIEKQVYDITYEAKSLADSMKKACQTKYPEKFPTQSDVVLMCSVLHPKHDSPLKAHAFDKSERIGDGNANWLHYMMWTINAHKCNIKKLLAIIPFLDADLVHILSDLEDCEFFEQIEKTYPNEHLTNYNLQFLNSGLNTYFRLIQKLDDYYYNNLSSCRARY